MAKRNSDTAPYSVEATDALVQGLAVHFGPSWKWSEIAEWTIARSDCGLPRWQVQWAKDFLENYMRSTELARTPVDISKGRSTRVPRRA